MEETLKGGRGPPRAVAPLEREYSYLFFIDGSRCVKWKYVQIAQHLVINSLYICLYILAAEWVLKNFFALRKKRIF